MHLLLSMLSEHYSSIKEMLSGNAVNELQGEDEYAVSKLKNYLLLRNCRRIFVLSVFQVLFGIISFIICLAGVKTASSGSVLFQSGSLLLSGTGIAFFYLFYRELRHRQQDTRKLNLYFYIYWAAFICEGVILSVGEYQVSKSVCCFCLFAATALVVPILRLIDSAAVSVMLAVPAVFYGAAEKQGFGFFVVLLIITLAFVWIFAEKYNCYAGMWLSERQLEQSVQRCLRISRTDSLTGMLNKAGLTAKFYERYNDASEDHKIAVLLIDVDNFRLYNHQYGYDASDRCLYSICNCIRIFAKPVTDMVSRFGGDDFVLVLEDMDELEVLRFAEQIRHGVERMALSVGENGIVTISIGISRIVTLENNDTYSVLLNEADIQLMIAKRGGKNCVGYRGRAFLAEDRRMTK